MSIFRSLPMAFGAFVVGAQSSAGQRARTPSFHSGLTATVVVTPAGSGQSCGDVTLHWAPHPAAKSYRSYVSLAKGGAWTALPSTSPCGAGRQAGATGFVDHQPAPAATTRRLFYRVVAIGPAGPIDSTDIVPVELTPSSSGGRP